MVILYMFQIMISCVVSFIYVDIWLVKVWIIFDGWQVSGFSPIVSSYRQGQINDTPRVSLKDTMHDFY